MSIRQEKENGMPVARIARRYGISRQSVSNVVNGVSGSGRERAPRASMLDPFKPYVRSRLARFDLPATVLLREIQRQGLLTAKSPNHETRESVQIPPAILSTLPPAVAHGGPAEGKVHVSQLPMGPNRGGRRIGRLDDNGVDKRHYHISPFVRHESIKMRRH